MTIVPFYAALLALFFVALSVRTLGLRRRFGISIGDGGNPTLLRAARVHSNFAEYVPLALLLLAFCETWQLPHWAVHALCLCLLSGRLLHAFGVSQAKETFVFRVAGMALTFTAMLCGAAWLLWRSAVA